MRTLLALALLVFLMPAAALAQCPLVHPALVGGAHPSPVLLPPPGPLAPVGPIRRIAAPVGRSRAATRVPVVRPGYRGLGQPILRAGAAKVQPAQTGVGRVWITPRVRLPLALGTLSGGAPPVRVDGALAGMVPAGRASLAEVLSRPVGTQHTVVEPPAQHIAPPIPAMLRHFDSPTIAATTPSWAHRRALGIDETPSPPNPFDFDRPDPLVTLPIDQGLFTVEELGSDGMDGYFTPLSRRTDPTNLTRGLMDDLQDQ
jgi:hypothetical protein